MYISKAIFLQLSCMAILGVGKERSGINKILYKQKLLCHCVCVCVCVCEREREREREGEREGLKQRKD